jgi:hypothetical protein
MQRLIAFLTMVFIAICFSGCTKVVPKEYDYYPPELAADKKCVDKCYYARKKCLQICVLKNKRYCNCTTSFNTCYSACGGQVVEKH